jgi:hypothetical protein
MPKNVVMFMLILMIFASLACVFSTPEASKPSLSTSAPAQSPSSTKQITQVSGQEASVPTIAQSPTNTGRSAGIDLLQDSPAQTATPDNPPTLAPQGEFLIIPNEWYKINSSNTVQDFLVTVLGWGISDRELKVNPEPGKKFVWVDAVVSNHSKAYIKFWSEGQASLKNETGEKYKPSLIDFRYEKADQGDFQIAPGEHLRHQYIFSVPQNETQLIFQYNACAGNDKVRCDHPAAIPLSKIPSGETPAPEIKAPDANAYPMGDIITVDDKAFSVYRWEVFTFSQFTPAQDAPQGIFLIKVSLAQSNLGQEKDTLGMTGRLWVNLKDETGRYFVPDLSKGPDGQIEPGERIQSDYYFQIIPGVKGLELVVDVIDPVKKWPTLKRTFISLGAQPALMASVLDKMPGSIAPNAVALGQPVQLGNYMLSVEKVDSPNTSFCAEIKKGQRAVLVTVNEKNTSNTTIVGYALKALLKDSQGKSYEACYMDDKSQKLGELEAGASKTIEYSFIIPDAPGDLWFAQYNFMAKDKKIYFLMK